MRRRRPAPCRLRHDEDDSAAQSASRSSRATLDGHPLISNRSIWRNFPWIWNERWSVGNMVLIGDALRTAHFSIGSGTRLAIEDAIALARALEAHPGDVPAALAAYEAARRPVVEKLVAAARCQRRLVRALSPSTCSSRPIDFAMSYIRRSGRVDDERLRAHGAALHGALRRAETPRSDADMMHARSPCRRDAPGAREIGFTDAPSATTPRHPVRQPAAGRGERTAVTGPGGTRTYAALCADAPRFGPRPAVARPARGERVLLFLDDTPAYPAAFFGAMRAGLVPLLINTLTPPDLLQFYLSDSGARVAVADAGFADRFDAAACTDTQLETLVVANGARQPRRACQRADRRAMAPQHPAQLAAADTIATTWRSGCTPPAPPGGPRASCICSTTWPTRWRPTPRHILKLTPDDICFSVPKIFFAYGLGNSMTFPFAAGASSVLLPGRPEAGAIFAAIAPHRPTVFFGLPTLYTALTDAPEASEAADSRSLRLCISAAEVLSEDVCSAWKRYRARHRRRPRLHRGAAHLPLQAARREEARRRRQARAGLRGRAQRSDGGDVGDGEEGILWVRGRFERADATGTGPTRPPRRCARSGWIYTGDRFLRDAEGFHYFRGRADDLVKVSGQWVHPMEVELCLANHPAVRECAVLASNCRTG